MKLSDFSDASPGRLVEIPGGHRAFVPSPIPRARPVRADVGKALGDARSAIGKLEAGISSAKKPDLLVRPFQRNEAVLSSRIEGTHTTLEESLVDDAQGLEKVPDDDMRAVRNYDHALQLGIAEISAGRDLTPQLLRSLQAELVKGDPKFERYAGKFRQKFVGIGPEECEDDVTLARFIPPPPDHLSGCIDDLASYLVEPTTEDPLIRVAMSHYQFETIHPFGDGNGRVGRLLIALQLVREGAVEKPWVYVSPTIERNRQGYYNALYRVSAAGDFDGWLLYFFNVVLEASRSMLAKLHALRELEEDFKSRLKPYHSQLPLRLLPYLFERPVVTIPRVASILGCQHSTARKTILAFEKYGILQKWDKPLKWDGQIGRPPDCYLAREVIRIVARGS